MTAFSLQASDALFYVGTYTNKGTCQGILMGRLNTKTGEVGPITLAGKADDPSFITLSLDGRFAYAALEGGEGAVAAFRREPDGTLTFLNQQPSGGKATCHVWATDRHLLAANYSGGNIASFPIKPDGSLEPRTQLVQFSGSGPNAKRQKQSYAHGIFTDKTGRFAYACDLGSDQVWSFHLDDQTGRLTPTQPPSAQVEAGHGPRHSAISADDRFLYVDAEMGHSVTVFERDLSTGLLSPLQTVIALPDETPGNDTTTAEIALHPSGRWLYVTHRGNNAVTLFKVAADGRLTRVETVPSPVNFPRGFALDPSGQWAVIVGQKDGKLSVLRIDQETGRLTPTGQIVDAGTPVSVVFARD